MCLSMPSLLGSSVAATVFHKRKRYFILQYSVWWQLSFPPAFASEVHTMKLLFIEKKDNSLMCKNTMSVKYLYFRADFQTIRYFFISILLLFIFTWGKSTAIYLYKKKFKFSTRRNLSWRRRQKCFASRRIRRLSSYR